MRVTTLPSTSSGRLLQSRRISHPPRQPCAASVKAAARNGNGSTNGRRPARKGTQTAHRDCLITVAQRVDTLRAGLPLPLHQPKCVLAAKKQGPDYKNVQRNLALELVRVTEAAALAGGKWYGRGDKNAADQVRKQPQQHRALDLCLKTCL